MLRLFWLLFFGFLSEFIWAQPQKLYFDQAYATGAPQSAVFDEVNYIPLETNRESVFGRINQLIVTHKYFIIWDTDTDAIYFFDKEGKFLKKLSDKRNTIKSIQLDKNKNALLIVQLSKSYLPSQKQIQSALDNPFKNSALKYYKSFYYDLNDINAAKTSPIKNLDFIMANPIILNSKYWAFSYIYANKGWDDITDYELKVSDGNKIVQSFFPYSRQKSSIFYGSPQKISFYNTLNPSYLLFTRPFNYSIYKFSMDTLIEAYQVVFPMANTLPNSFFTQNFESRKAFEDYKQKNAGFVWGLDNIVEFKNLLFFSIDTWRSFNERNFILNKTTNQFLNYNKISADSSNYFLPPTGYRVQYFDENYLYSSVPSSSMFQSYESSKTRNVQYPPTLKVFFEKAKQTDNPVIIQIKPKTK